MSDNNRQWIFLKRPQGTLTEDIFELRQTAIEKPKDGKILVRTALVSLDPANRAWMEPTPTYKEPVMPGDVMHGFAIGRVVESSAEGFQPGDVVEGMLGWQEYATVPAATVRKRNPRHSMENLLGVLGITGLTAYYGLLEVAKIAAGETVVISAAAGAVGTITGQIAKLKGCRVIGIAGGPEKCAWITEGLGFDVAVDYKSADFKADLAKAVGEGVDVYFDNVGGDIFEAIIPHLKTYARVVACGTLTDYNDAEPQPGPRGLQIACVVKRLRIEGFIVLDYMATWDKAEEELAGWIEAGSLKPPVDVREGFETLPANLIGLFKGTNRGKLMVRIAPVQSA
ncbi:MAG: hypothetical protein BGN95_00560 [Sphingomonas sp. 66-10]|uniref:NADP-dependent oxidoreductase n=1 Tax=Sphingomonas sp. 66-10 TaxID=1895848 RepID=UPI0009260849|nr:NADP-dependent oxidoreductase [Sphingomonas sp. 66-10]OJU18239.1 MAG: hypothetical protein BGN95_00560 [Sphingomonas sp. 66-10]